MKKIYVFKISIRVIIGLVICIFFAWINHLDISSLLEYGISIIGFAFFLIAYFGYLNSNQMTGERISHINFANNITQKVGWDLVDNSTGEHSNKVDIISNIVAGIIFIIPSFIYALMNILK